jgi:hypothetical protein
VRTAADANAVTRIDGFDDEWYARELLAIYGDLLSEAILPSGLLVSAGNLVGMKTTAGATLANSTVGRFKTTMVNGVRATAPNGAALKAMVLDDAVVRQVMMCVHQSTTGLSAYENLAGSFTGNGFGLLRSNGANTWETTGGAAGWSHYTDGVASETIPTSGIHLSEGLNASSTAPGMQLLGTTAGSQAWGGNALAFIFLTGAQSAGQRARGVLAARKRFRY